MADRKVLNKYYPPDFDPSKLPKGKKPKNDQIKVTTMLPMSVRCTTCGEFMYQGTKFNARKEDVTGEDYLGLRIFRFYIRCKLCSAEIVYKTDPQNSDYAMEAGASRNYEQWRDQRIQAEELEERRKDIEGDAILTLESRTMDSRKEMEALDQLDEIKTINARNARLDAESILAEHKKITIKEQFVDEDEELVRKYFSTDGEFVRRLSDDEGEGEDGDVPEGGASDGETEKTAFASKFSSKVVGTAEATKRPLSNFSYGAEEDGESEDQPKKRSKVESQEQAPKAEPKSATSILESAPEPPTHRADEEKSPAAPLPTIVRVQVAPKEKKKSKKEKKEKKEAKSDKREKTVTAASSAPPAGGALLGLASYGSSDEEQN